MKTNSRRFHTRLCTKQKDPSAFKGFDRRTARKMDDRLKSHAVFNRVDEIVRSSGVCDTPPNSLALRKTFRIIAERFPCRVLQTGGGCRIVCEVEPGIGRKGPSGQRRQRSFLSPSFSSATASVRPRSSNAFSTNEGTTLSKTPERLCLSKVAIIAPRDEHCSKTCQITIRMFSNQKFNRNICPDVSATFESFSTHAHHAER